MAGFAKLRAVLLPAFPWSAWPIFFICCSGGLVKIVYAFGYGYGVSMFAQGFLAYVIAGGMPDAAFPAALYAAYGWRLATFLFRRDHSDAFLRSSHGQSLEDAMRTTPLLIKFNVVFFVSLVQQATMLTLDTICRHRGFRGLGRLAFGIALGGLLLEAAADEQKLYYKTLEPELPVTTGLYSIVRHPNYSGEILFWLGVVGMCLASSDMRTRKIVFSAGPLFMCWVMLGAAKRLDAKNLNRYSEVPGYVQYAESTSSLLPGVL